VDKKKYLENLTKSNIKNEVLSLFEDRYLNDVSLPKDHVKKIISSYDEEMSGLRSTHPPIKFIQKHFSKASKGKVLIVGLGLSYGYVYDFFNGGAEVYGIEPDKRYLEIQKKHAKILDLCEDNFVDAIAEKIPFDDESFDFVYCYTVIEHVQDVEKSLLEMYRVLKKNGFLYIETPDYRILQEPHYKLFYLKYYPLLVYAYQKLSPGMRKRIVSIFLKIKKRNTKFLDSINFLDEKTLKKFFFTQGWEFFQYHQETDSKKNSFWRKVILKFGIPKNLWFFITK